MRVLIAVTLVSVAAIGVGLWFGISADPAAASSFRASAVVRGDFRVTLPGTGTLEPEEVIDVGAQVAGIIREFGVAPDGDGLIDYGSRVDPGTVLARIDDALYREEVTLARSGVLQAEASLQRAAAELDQQQVRAEQARRDQQRAELLYARNSVSAQDVEAAVLAVKEAEISVSIGQAARRQAEAALETAQAAISGADAAELRARANLRKAETNLGYTTITSPISGIIIDRRVNIGQTVVASLNAPSLFLIAKDIGKLEIWASVNEADIGSVREEQQVSFTVDALADREFVGTVTQIRLNASMIQNVVTYTVVIAVDNAAGHLLPYMTANLRFEVEHHEDVLLVPSAAVRWRPPPERIHPDVREAADVDPESPRLAGQGVVWVEDGGFVRPLPVQVGGSDWVQTEVSGEGLREGLEVVVGERRQESDLAGVVNPFAVRLTKPKGGK
jgi:HlyD family secretion protein